MKVLGYEIERLGKQPLHFALLILVVSMTIAGLEKLANYASILDSDPNSPWIITTSFVLFYAIFSSIFSLRSDQLNLYWRDAIFGFLGLCFLSIMASQLLSGIGMEEAGSFRWLYVVLAIGYLVFLVIVRLMRKIVEIAIRQDDRFHGD